MSVTMGQTPGSPYVTVTKTGTDGDYSVTRTVAGVITPVRGTLTVTAGTGNLVDREAPQGTSVTYTVGAETSTPTVTLSVGSYLIHPTNSSLDMAVMVGDYPTWTRRVAQDTFLPLGSGKPIVVSGARGAREGGGFSVMVRSAAESTALEALLESSRILLLSTVQYRAPYLWVAVGDESWEPLTKGASDVLWRVTLPLTEIDRPEVTTSGRVTWLDVAARGYDTWTELDAAYGTWDVFLADAATWNG